jgi:peptidoglycan/xylan/chitin deacetylase (PgdA/CDA1 family)
LFVTADSFAAQLDLLHAQQWEVLDLDGYLAARSGARAVGRRSVLLTIDDGYESTLDVAAPLLARHDMPAVLFVPPGHLGATSTWMSDMAGERLLAADRLRELAGYRIELGAHGFDHVDMAGMSPESLRRNVFDAREALAELTGTRPRSFAYPSGVHDEAARRAVRDAGYDVAFAVHDDAGRFAVPRTDVNATDTARSFRLKVSRAWPAAYSIARRMPAVRRAAHRVVGSARAVGA